MNVSRRAFVGTAAAAMAAPSIAQTGGAKRVFKVGLVGCGGRGCNWFGGKCSGGAIRDITAAAQRLGHDVQLVAAAEPALPPASTSSPKSPSRPIRADFVSS